MLEHGGNLRQAARRYQIPYDNWVDLSTGVNPQHWPIPEINPASWHRLPEFDDGLIEAARKYYQAESILAVAGSQAAIQALPVLRPAAKVGMLPCAYAEHEHNWARQGHEIIHLDEQDIEKQLDSLDVLLLINPNNPTGQTFSMSQLLSWHRRLSERSGWLVVDEAFIDCTPEQSLAYHTGQPGLIVLRSIGKFFGLAGVRTGFVLAEPGLLDKLNQLLGPWTVSGPAREIVSRALLDREWHSHTRQALKENSARLRQLLRDAGFEPSGGSCLFQWLQHPLAGKIHTCLAQEGIWTRFFKEPHSVRFGLPANEHEWQVLSRGLAQLSQDILQRDEINESAILI